MTYEDPMEKFESVSKLAGGKTLARGHAKLVDVIETTAGRSAIKNAEAGNRSRAKVGLGVSRNAKDVAEMTEVAVGATAIGGTIGALSSRQQRKAKAKDSFTKFLDAEEIEKGEMADAKAWRKSTTTRQRFKQAYAEPQYRKGTGEQLGGIAGVTAGASGAIASDALKGKARVAGMTASGVSAAAGTGAYVKGAIDQNKGLKRARNKSLGRG